MPKFENIALARLPAGSSRSFVNQDPILQVRFLFVQQNAGTLGIARPL